MTNNTHPLDRQLRVDDSLKELVLNKVTSISDNHRYRKTHVVNYRGQWLIEVDYLMACICDDDGKQLQANYRDRLCLAIQELANDQSIIVVDNNHYQWIGLYEPGEEPKPEPTAKII